MQRERQNCLNQPIWAHTPVRHIWVYTLLNHTCMHTSARHIRVHAPMNHIWVRAGESHLGARAGFLTAQNGYGRVICMKIAICDDEPIFLKRIYSYLWQEPDCCVECFTSPVPLWERYQAGERYDVVFLDIIMTPITGMELAKKIRTCDRSAILVFFSVSPDFALSGYETGAFRYLLKPVTKAALSRVMNDIYKKLAESQTLLIKTPECSLLLHPHELQYLQADNKNTLIYHKGDIITLRRGLSELESLLPPRFFFRIHRRYVVNLTYVCEFDDMRATLSCGQTFPVSRRRSRAFRLAIQNYIEGDFS